MKHFKTISNYFKENLMYYLQLLLNPQYHKQLVENYQFNIKQYLLNQNYYQF